MWGQIPKHLLSPFYVPGMELSWETFNTRISAEPDQHWEDFGGRCPGLVPSAFLPHLPSLPAHQGIRARDQLHRHLEEAIAEKLHEDKAAAEPGDALDGIIHSTRELGHELSVQELKVGGGRFLIPSFAFLAGLYTHAASLEQWSCILFGPTLSHRHSSGRGESGDLGSAYGSAAPTISVALGQSPSLSEESPWHES